MSIPYLYAKDHLQSEVISVRAADAVIDLPETDDNDEAFFSIVQAFLTKKYVEGISRSQRVKHFTIFNKLAQIISTTSDKISHYYSNNLPVPDIYHQKLLRALLCEGDILKMCKDLKLLKINPTFLQVLELVSDFDHLANLYANASLNFRRMDLHVDDVGPHTAILFHALPFMKLFEAYNYDAAWMYNWEKGVPYIEQKAATSLYNVDIEKAAAGTASDKPSPKKNVPPLSINHNDGTDGNSNVSLKEDLEEKALQLFTYGKQVLEFMQKRKFEGIIVPKYIANDIITKYGLEIEAGSHQYFILIAEITMCQYILKNNLEELIIILTSIQSFFGNFYLSNKVFNKNQKQLSFLVYEFRSEFQPLPSPFIIDMVRDYFERIQDAQTQPEKIQLMKYLDSLLAAITFALNLVTHLSQAKSKIRYNFILRKLFLLKTHDKTEANNNNGATVEIETPKPPAAKDSSYSVGKRFNFLRTEVGELQGYEELKEYEKVGTPRSQKSAGKGLEIEGGGDHNDKLSKPEFLKLLELSLMLLQTLNRKLDDPTEIQTFTMNDKYGNWEFFPHNIFENLLQILVGVGEELKARGENAIFEFNGILAGCRLIQRALDQYIYQALQKFDLFESYITSRELEISMWWIWCMREQPQNQFYSFLTLCFKKLEEIIKIVIEDDFLDRIRASQNPQAFVDKLNSILRFLNRNSIFVFKTAEQYNPEQISRFRELVLNSNLIEYLLEKSSTWSNDWISQAVRNQCVGELLNILFNSRANTTVNICSPRFYDILEKSGQLILNNTSRYHLFELSSTLLQILENENLLYQVKDYLPGLLQKVFLEVLPDISIHDTQLHASVLNFALPPLFAAVDITKQADFPENVQISIECIIGLLTKLEEFIINLQQDFLAYDFSQGLWDQRQRNEAKLARLSSYMIRFAKIFQHVLPHFRSCVHLETLRGQEQELQNIILLVNSIIMNPLVQMLPPQIYSFIFSIMKEIYSLNSSPLLILTTNLVFANFIKASKDLGETFITHWRHRNPLANQTSQYLRKLLENYDKFWNNFNDQQVECFETLGQKTVFSLFTLNMVHQYLEKYLVNLSVSAETMMALGGVYQELLNTCLDLSLTHRLEASSEVEEGVDPSLAFTLLGQDNLYLKLVLRNITPLLLMTQTELIIACIEQFLTTNLSVNRLLIENTEGQDWHLIYKQICSFDMILNILQEGNSFFDIFIIQDKLLKPLLSWITGIILNYKKIIGEKIFKIPALDRSIGAFMRLANSSVRSLHQKHPVNHGPPQPNKKASRINESQYIKFIYDLFQGDFSFYEECYPDSEALDAISRGILGVALRMLEYKQLHNSGDQHEDEELDKLRQVESDLKEPHFYEEVYLALKAIVRRGLGSNCFINVLLRDKECLDVFEGTDSKEINGWIAIMFQNTFNDITKQEETWSILSQRDLFRCLKVLEYTMEKPAKVLSLVLEASEGKDVNFLDDPQEAVKKFLESFSLEEMKKIEGKGYFGAFMANYCLLLGNLYKNVEVSLLAGKEEDCDGVINEETLKKLAEYFEFALVQLKLQSQFAQNSTWKPAKAAALQEVYRFIISLWWYGQRECLEKVVNDPEIIGLLIENADDEASFNILKSFLCIYGLNGFTLETQLEFLFKGLRQAGVRRMKGNYRIRVCQHIIDNQNIENLEDKLQLDQDGDFIKKENDDKITVIDSNDGQIKLVPTHHMIFNGFNPVTKKLINGFLHTYLTWFPIEATNVKEGKACDGKVLRIYYLIAFFMRMFPELSLYMLSYPVNLKEYGLESFVQGTKEKVTFLHFIIRSNFYLFPGICLLQVGACSNRGQYIAIQFEKQAKFSLLHETIIQLYLNEILKATQEDLVQHDQTLFKSPQIIWKWAIYITQALDLLFSYSSPRYMDLQSQLIEGYLVLLLRYITKVGRNPHTSSEILMSCLLRSLQRLIETDLIRGYNSRVGKLKAKTYLYIYGKQSKTPKLLHFLTFIAKKSKKNTSIAKRLKAKKSKANPEQILETMEKIVERERLNHEECPDFAEKDLQIIGSKLRHSKWWSHMVKSSTSGVRKPSDPRVENFGDTETLHNRIIEEIDSFSEKSAEVKEFRRLIETAKMNEKVHYYWLKQFVGSIRVGMGAGGDYFFAANEESIEKDTPTKNQQNGGEDKSVQAGFSRLLRKILGINQPKHPQNNDHLEDQYISYFKEEEAKPKKNEKKKKKGIRGFSKGFLRRVLRFVTNNEAMLKKKLTELREGDIMKLVQETDWRSVDSFNYVFTKQSTKLDSSLNALSEEEKAALLYLLPETELSAEFKEKAKEIKAALQEAINKGLKIEEDFPESSLWMRSHSHVLFGRDNRPSDVNSDYESDQEEEAEESVKDQRAKTKKEKRGSEYNDEEEGEESLKSVENEEDQETDQTSNIWNLVKEKANQKTMDFAGISEDEIEEEEEEPIKEEDKMEEEDESSEESETEKTEEQEDNDEVEFEFFGGDTTRPVVTVLEDIMKLEGIEGEDNLDSVSLCSNSDLDEAEYTKYEEQKAKQDEVLEGFYEKNLLPHLGGHTFDDFYNVVITIPDKSLIDILAFFVNESYFDMSYPSIPDVRQFFHQLEFLMINPRNQARIIHVLTMVINCKIQYLTVPNLEPHNFSLFLANILKFLQFYLRKNPESFFEYKPEDLYQYNSVFKLFLKPDIDFENIFEIPLRSSLPSRVLQSCPKEFYRKDGLLKEKTVNFFACLAKRAHKTNKILELNEADVQQIGYLIRTDHCWMSAPFRRRLGKLMRYISKIPSTREIVFSIEREFVKEKLPLLAQTLSQKWQTGLFLVLTESEILDQDKAQSIQGKLIKCLGPLHDALSVFYCRELERLCGILKYLNHSATTSKSGPIGGESALVKLDKMEGANTLLAMVCKLLIHFKGLLKKDAQYFSVLSSIVEPYVYCLIHIFRDQEDILQLVEKTSKLKDLVNMVFDFNPRKTCKDRALLVNMSLSSLKCLLEFEVKEKIMRTYFVQGRMNRAASKVLLEVQREKILLDSLKGIEQNLTKLCKSYSRLRIMFTGEPGIDEGGLKKEWILLLTDHLFDPRAGLFKTSHNLRCLYPSPQSFLVPHSMLLFKLAGNVIGLSIKENIPTGISFANNFIKFILDLEANLEDLEEIEPELAKSLRYIRQNPIDESLGLSFTYELDILNVKKTIELIENGNDVSVTDENKKEYINLFLKAKLFKEIEAQANAFKEGLFQIVPKYLVKHFLPYELELLICGQTEIALEDLKHSVQYKNCSNFDPLIQWFWEILEDFTQQERVSLLMFLTGSASIPYRGIKEFKITIIKTNTSPDHLPVSHTCFSELELPNYQSKEILEMKLKFVITEGREGFHLA